MNMYRYTVNEGDYGGCVLAASEDEGLEKVLAFYEKDQDLVEYYNGDFNITVWTDDEFPPDVIQVY